MQNTNEKARPASDGTGLNENGLHGNIDRANLDQPATETQVTIRLAELRDQLVDEWLRLIAICLQIVAELREPDDIAALVDLRRLWVRAQRISTPASELKALLGREGGRQ